MHHKLVEKHWENNGVGKRQLLQNQEVWSIDQQNSSSFGSASSRAFHRSESWSGILSSWASFFMQRSRRISLAVRIKGATNPSGSYIELTTDRIPLLGAGLSFMVILKPKVSKTTCQRTPRALSIGAWSKSKSFTNVARSDVGMDSITARELDSHLVRWNPPFFNRLVRSFTWLMAVRSDSTHFKQSST